MPSQPPPYLDSAPVPDAASPSPGRHDRADAASSLLEFDEARLRGSSQRAAAEQAGVPRSTLRYRSDRRSGLDLPPPVAAFLETPTGLAWLHRLVLAATFVMTLRGPEGIRLVCEFLELSGLAEVDEALQGLPVELIQSTSDQGKALLRHARDLEAHHSPDLFHPQHDLSKAMALPLAGRVRRAAESYEKAVRERERHIAKYEVYRSERHGPGRPPDFAGRIERARAAVEEAQQAVEQALADQENCREAISGLSADYHCYRLADGCAQHADQVETLVGDRFTVIDEVAERAGLSEKCLAKIDKARRVTSDMVATIRFVHTEIAVRLAGLDIPFALRTEVASKLVPGLYLQRVAERASLAEDRRALAATAEQLLAPLRSPEHPLQRLDAATTEQVEGVAKTCADLFQRSSSCVEGRNGQLALFHHGLHRLTDKKLAALTAVHNFHTRRLDGTTPAERFFETEHRDLFSALVERMPQLARPARPRSLRPYRASMRRAS